MFDGEAMGRRIRRKRQEQGLTQAQFAKKIGVSTSFYGHIERGSRTPSIDTLVIIANALNVGLDALLRDSLKVPIRLDPSGGLSRKDIGVLRTYLSNQQAALEKWNDGSRRK